MTEYLAHTGEGLTPHLLIEHLQQVAIQARSNMCSRGDRCWPYLAGLWHDLGKYRPGFQKYIRLTSDAHIEGKLPANSDKSHSAAGALHAISMLEARHGAEGAKAARLLAYVIAGHHAGLSNWTAGLDARLLGTGAANSSREHREALDACSAETSFILDLPDEFELISALRSIPGVSHNNPLAVSHWIRMLFSALVDADFLDTEQFMDSGKSGKRYGNSPLPDYLSQLDSHLEKMAVEVERRGRSLDPVMRARNSVLAQCRKKATLPSGVFTLTVPTGGGKTLSSLAFALKHAVAQGKRRVIYAIPYTSIIEQTAEVFSGIFGIDAVVEHHSQIDVADRAETQKSRLACENWDAPLVVTTNVQLFESLFATRTSRCRKLHNIADSVIVLDEAQLLPPEFIQPILDVLNLLVAHYGVTLVLCTATQPVLASESRFDPRQNLRGLPASVNIVDDEESLFQSLERVTVEWPLDLQTPIQTCHLVERLASHDSVLAVVNTRKDAAEIVAALDMATGDACIHLSAAMCGQHRADVIREIRARLAARRDYADSRPLRVVSTQLVEAGVDIDFPVVYRALAGLDSIAQAAGRCNREGRLQDGEKGRVVVFVRDVPAPLTAIRAGIHATRSTVSAGFRNALAPDAYARYFPLYYDGFQSRDKCAIVEKLRTNPDLSFDFRDAAEQFRLVDDADQVALVVPYRSKQQTESGIESFISRLRSGDVDRWLMRKLQRYTINVRKRQVDAWVSNGTVQETKSGLFVLNDPSIYDQRLGLMAEGKPLDAASLVQ